jgi:hypothetical protein
MPIMPFDTFPQMEDDHESSSGYIPGFCQITHDIEVFVILDEPVVHQRSNAMGCTVRREDGDQIAGVSYGTFYNNIPIRRHGV